MAHMEHQKRQYKFSIQQIDQPETIQCYVFEAENAEIATYMGRAMAFMDNWTAEDSMSWLEIAIWTQVPQRTSTRPLSR